MGFCGNGIDFPGTEPIGGKNSMECSIWEISKREGSGNSSLCVFLIQVHRVAYWGCRRGQACRSR
jgi:hypothetical protein